MAMAARSSLIRITASCEKKARQMGYASAWQLAIQGREVPAPSSCGRKTGPLAMATPGWATAARAEDQDLPSEPWDACRALARARVAGEGGSETISMSGRPASSSAEMGSERREQ